MTPQLLEQKFSVIQPFLKELKKHVSETLGSFADENGFPFYGRIKTTDSISEKIEMGRYRQFSDLDDLVAFTLIIPSAAFESEAIAFCKSKFDVLEVRNKSNTEKAPEVFRFDATRVIARVRPRPDIELGIPSIFDWRFEIQIRTAFEHAWAVATHDLVYKGSAMDWRRVRLAAQLKAISEGLDAAIGSFDGLALAISESPSGKSEELKNVAEFVNALFETERLPSVLRPQSVSRFSENFRTLLYRLRPKVGVVEALNILTAQLPEGTKSPMSLSLYQLFLGVISQNREFEVTDGMSCHVTPELIALYPRTGLIKATFNYET